MRLKLLVVILFMSIWIADDAIAKGWISVGLPSIYTFSQEDKSFFSFGSTLSGKPSGYMIHGSIYKTPFVGYEKYRINLLSDNTDEVTAIIDIEFYDIGLNFEQRFTHFLIGYGYGTIKTECEFNACSSINFNEGIARQYFAQLGVVLFEKLNFHLSAHRVTGQNDIAVGTVSDHLVLDGMLYAFGLKLGW